MISDRLKSSLKREFDQSLMAKIGLAIALVIILVATFAPILATHHPGQTGHFDEEGSSYPPIGFDYETHAWEDGDDGRERVPHTVEPTSEHVLGTNNLGQDVYSRMLFGARTSLLVGLIGTGLAAAFGVPFGLVAGYFGGRTDDSMMRVADIMLAFPSLVLAIALIGVFGRSVQYIPDPIVMAGFADGMPEYAVLPGTVTLVVALVNWVWFARVARGEALAIRNEEYVKAARSLGASNWTVLRKHVLPNSLTPIIVLATIQVAAIILLESSLSYLGFSGTTLSWGYEISQGQDYLRTAWWISTIPGIAIVLAVISINLLGDWLRDALDPNIEGEGGV
ncbi:ABC-type transport system permease protein (probable substrate dipeptide/oligopeptide) [Natrialba magadii ATCC 43099]|uniref:ABC-type transport system permease protein (Probable substrate dipeptide/oligopeptide) n=1 Tax=Natrialba magadii (strain ATCC 43099 / DSM 3394 / CCM 3739 / CIP 104546 / IAM 13178 / JCM 8861 / NBRC 102185 / NCIMB 2190 / MS3) TaxID=547559 RepID=D3SWI2_NATMM|nr:ABC transporter permease [Natrialba magadii]ADD03774.1 ABC-type transport system permease protein (probable substrate dipeptide/oligopeptide) [Natrialba magadii ATCC 43099]ELY33829.1 binding-protein-dependent transporters inner membrane component [Natrialba magadii ATCC 43099]